MNRRILILLWGICFVLSGCGGRKPVEHGVVCRITVTAPNQTKEFTSQEQIAQILDGLRNLGQRTTAQHGPDSDQGSGWRIAVKKTDGTVNTYILQGDCYIRQNDKPWQQMDSRLHLQLRELLAGLTGEG